MCFRWPLVGCFPLRQGVFLCLHVKPTPVPASDDRVRRPYLLQTPVPEQDQLLDARTCTRRPYLRAGGGGGGVGWCW